METLIKHILTNETDTGILVKTIRAVGEYKLRSLADEINEYIYFDNDELKANAVHSLEQIGSPRAIALLEHAATTVKCDQNIVDALFNLKQNPTTMLPATTDAMEKEANLFRALESMDLDTRFNAVTRLADLGNKNPDHKNRNDKDRTKFNRHRLAQNILSTDHDLVINTLDIIRRTCPKELLVSLYGLVADTTISPTVKFAAYEALGAFPKIDLSPCPLSDIDDPNLYVQMAVIKLIDKNPTDGALGTIRQKIETGREKGEKLVQTILEVKAARIIDTLMQSDTFSYIASNYLTKHASLPCLEKYIEILMDRGLKTTAKKFTLILEKKTKEKRPTAIVLGRSETMVSFFSALVHKKGYNPLGFISSQDAFERAVESKPELIVSELFIDKITVVEFARQICEFYPSKELAFVISTLQQAFTGNRLRDVCNRIRVQEILAFPPDSALIAPAG